MKKFIILSFSLLILILSLAITTNFSTAWFSDEVVSKNNKIKTGSLKVDLSFCDSYNCLNPKKVDNSPIFEKKLWQPKDFEVKYFNISNVGSLPLTYQLNLVSDNLSLLSNQLEVCVSDAAFKLEDYNLIDKRDFSFCKPLSTIILEKVDLAANTLENLGNSSEIMLVLYLPSWVENIDEQDSEVVFDVVVRANQKAYNEKVYVKTVKQLEEIANKVNTNQDSFINKTIILENNLNLSKLAWKPIGSKAYPFRGSFDGGGNTIEGLNVDREDLENVGLFGKVSGSDTYLKNLTIKDTNLKGKSKVGGLLGSGEGVSISNIFIENINIKGDSNFTGGVVGSLAGSIYNSSVKNIYIDLYKDNQRSAEAVGAIAGYISKADGSYYNLSVLDFRIFAANKVGGIFGEVSNNITIKDCIVKKDLYGSLGIYSQKNNLYIGDFVGKGSEIVKSFNCQAIKITKFNGNYIID